MQPPMTQQVQPQNTLSASLDLRDIVNAIISKVIPFKVHCALTGFRTVSSFLVLDHMMGLPK